MKDIKNLLEIRAEMKRKKPHFKRHDRNKLGRLARSGWRRSVQGHDNKQRNRYAGNEKSPTPGYGSPADVRGMHPSGYNEAIVHNAAELDGIDAKKTAIRVGGTVGNRKKIEIVDKARKLNFKILNPKYFQPAAKPLKSDATKAAKQDAGKAGETEKKEQPASHAHGKKDESAQK